MISLLCCFGIIVSIFLLVLSNGMSLSFLYIPCFVLVVLLMFFRFKNERIISIRDFWLRPSLICAFGLIVLGYQLLIDDCLGFSSIEQSIFSSASQYADFSFFTITIFLLSYIIGLGIKCRDKFHSVISDTNRRHANIWLILMLISFVLFVASIDLLSFLTGTIYHGSGSVSYQYSISDSLEVLYQTFFYVTLACYTKLISKDFNNTTNGLLNLFWSYIKSFPFVFWTCVVLYLILRLLSGDRGPFIYNSLAIIYSFIFVSKYKFKFITVVIVLLVGAAFITFLGTFRSRSSDLSVIEKISESIERRKDINDQSICNATKELAKSVDTHFIAVKNVLNNETSFSFGKYTILSLTGAIPGFKKKYLYDIGIKPEELSSAVYFTISNQGPNYTFGEGSSIYGEAFLEFGVLGMFLFGLLLGYIFKYTDFLFMYKRPISLIYIFIILELAPRAIYIARSSFSYELSRILHVLIIFYIFNLFVKKLCR